jgi:uncharacterized caspase-like protein
VKRYAIIIGVNNYHELPQLEAATLDAMEMYSLLRDGMEFDHVESFDNDNASQTAIFDGIERLCVNAAIDDQLLIYFAGHSVVHKDVQLLLLPQTRLARIEMGATEVLNVEVLIKLTEGYGLQRLLITDICRTELVVIDGQLRSRDAAAGKQAYR